MVGDVVGKGGQGSEQKIDRRWVVWICGVFYFVND